jgi:hypothetical protein
MTDSIKFGNLAVEITKGKDVVTYVFRGDVDEHFKQENLPRHTAETINFELSGIENFNSCGIREWIYLIKDFTKLGKLVFQRCSVTMIDQINMVPDSIGSATIDSFFAPYYCQTEDCSQEVNRIVQVADHIQNLIDKVAPEFQCETCGKPLDFDALEDSYFLFLKSIASFKKSS